MMVAAIQLVAENGKRVGNVARAKRLAAEPVTEAARLRRCLASIRREAEQAQSHAKAAEFLLAKVYAIACGDDPILTRAMVREALIEGANAHRVGLVVRYCEMAEEGTLCA